MDRLDLAREFLKDAEVCLNNGGYRSTASRSYYALFHACIALFEHFGYRPSNFRGRGGQPARRWEHKLISVDFHVEFTQRRKVFPWKVGTVIRTLYSSRLNADYRPHQVITHKQATERMRQAKEIVAQIRRVIEA